MKAERVLITGGAGFIGNHLVDDQLALGHQVTVIDTRMAGLALKNDGARLQLVEADIRDTSLLRKTLPGMDVVFHLASAHLETNRNESFYRDVNVEGTRNLALIAAQEGVRRFVHCSSVGVFGPLARVPANEESRCHPEIAYEVTKLEGERAVQAIARQHGLPAVILRPSWVYGPGCPRTRKLFRAVRKKRFVMVGRGHNLRHPVFIDDMLQAFGLAANREDIEGQVFIIASADYVTLEELIQSIQHVVEVHFSPITVPADLMRPICHAVELVAKVSGREPPFSRRSLKFFLEDSAFDITKARRDLGYSPRVDLAAGLKKTWNALYGFRAA